MRGDAEQAVFERFSKKYEILQSDVMRGIERTVCGCDYGATSWTTLAEARRMHDLLGAKPGDQLLDVGSGSGWPGIYLAEQSGCDLTMVDLPLVGLKIALSRANEEQIGGSSIGSVGDAAALPFRSGAFDAIIHSDVLCCLVEKLAAIKSCRRVVRDDGKMVFSVILITPGLSPSQYERASVSGPPFIASDIPYPEMLDQAGWDITEHRDLTGVYEATVGHMLEQWERHAVEIDKLFGEEDAEAERDRRRATLGALGNGLLRRELFCVVPRGGAG